MAKPCFYDKMGKEKKTELKVVEHYLLKKHGLFNFDKGFSSIQSWLNSHDYDFIEKGRGEKVGSTGRGLESEWGASRKVTDYVEYNITIRVWLRDMTDIAVEKDGKTVKVNRGRLEIIFDSKMVKNYTDKYGKSKFNTRKGSFSNFLREIYEKYIASGMLGDYEDKLADETNDLIATVKSSLEA